MKTLLLSIITILSLYIHGVAQMSKNIDVPTIGQKFESIEIHDPKNDKFFNDSLKLFANKYLIFDYFSSGCTSCFTSFPKLKEFQKKFKDHLQFILVGYEDRHIRKQYAIYQRKLNLDLPIVYDSVFANFTVPVGFPHLIWVDKNGIIQAITAKDALTEENLNKFISDQKFEFFDRSHVANQKIAFNSSNNTLFDWYSIVDKNESRIRRIDIDTLSIFKSEFGTWEPHMTMNPPEIVWSGPNAKQAISGMGSLESLFLFAYVNSISWASPYNYNVVDSSDIYYSVYPKPEIEGIDSTAFFGSLERANTLFWYQLIVKNRSITDEELYATMRSDLKRVFGYEGRFIRKKVKCYCMIADKSARAKLATKGGKPDVTLDKTSIRLTNQPMSTFSNILLRMYLANTMERNLYYDNTELKINIDINLEGILFDSKFVKPLLKKYGLDVVECEREMKVLKVSKVNGN